MRKEEEKFARKQKKTGRTPIFGFFASSNRMMM
jgi:hypothetical protein